MSDIQWVDTHGHLFMLEDRIDDVMGRAHASDVAWIVCPGVDADSSRQSEALAMAYPDTVLWSAGLHPHEASAWRDQAEAITGLASRADAIGECGLDYYRNLAPRDDQRVAFAAQLALASDLGKPIIIHCRDAFADVHAMLEDAQLGEDAVLHCWTGGPKWTKRFAALGVTFSFAGPLTYTTGDTLRLGAAQAPPERTLVETDSPYLTPEPFRGSDNEPRHVGLTGAKLAEVWGVTTADVAASTTAHARKVFRHG